MPININWSQASDVQKQALVKEFRTLLVRTYSSSLSQYRNQTIEVKTAQPTSTFDIGFTGSAGKKITATLAPAATTTILASFTSFFVPKKIPTSITVPCSGTGTVIFAPSPTSSTAKSAKLPVTFLNIGT